MVHSIKHALLLPLCNLIFLNPIVTLVVLLSVLRPMRDPTYRERTIIISLLSVFSVAVIILATYFVYRCCFQPQHVPVLTTNATEEEPEPTFDIDKLKISCQITKGRYRSQYTKYFSYI